MEEASPTKESDNAPNQSSSSPNKGDYCNNKPQSELAVSNCEKEEKARFLEHISAENRQVLSDGAFTNQAGPSQENLEKEETTQNDEEPQKTVDELFAEMLEMGFEEDVIELALRKATDLDTAIQWIVDHSNVSDFEGVSDEESDDEEEISYRPHKMVFVVNQELKMGVGKVAAQVGHAALAVNRVATKTEEGQKMIDEWNRRGCAKIVLKGDNTEHLLNLFKEAKDKGVFAYIVQDAGHTQVARGSRTVLGLFGPTDLVNSISGKLRLL